MEPNPPSWGRSWAQDKSNWAAKSAVFRENSKLWTKIHTRLTHDSLRLTVAKKCVIVTSYTK